MKYLYSQDSITGRIDLIDTFDTVQDLEDFCQDKTGDTFDKCNGDHFYLMDWQGVSQ